MADTNPAATLAGAKRIADGLQFACRLPDKKPDFTACGGPAAEAYWEYFHPARVVSLVAALEAVLALADDWAVLAPPDDWGESMAGTVAADCGRALRAAITTALTGPTATEEG